MAHTEFHYEIPLRELVQSYLESINASNQVIANCEFHCSSFSNIVTIEGIYLNEL